LIVLAEIRINQMKNLDELKEEHDEINSRLIFPFDLTERQQLCERRRAILVEAQALALELNISGHHWFNQDE
jgi:hypothetical protein